MSIIDCTLDFDASLYIQRPNTSTRLPEAATGITGMEFRISATRGGAAIDSSLAGTATEAASAPGTYVFTFNQPDLADNLLPTYAGKTVYLVVEKSGDISTKSFPHYVQG